MQPMSIPVPPQLESALGYQGNARYFAFHWMPAGDEVIYDDGCLSSDGYWTAYLAYIGHPAVAPELVPFDLGTSDSEATHWLIIDRRDRRAWVAQVAKARQFLRGQWRAVEPAVLTEGEWQEVIDRFQKELLVRTLPTMEEITAAMREQQRIEQEMVRWLDARVQARAAHDVVQEQPEE